MESTTLEPVLSHGGVCIIPLNKGRIAMIDEADLYREFSAINRGGELRTFVLCERIWRVEGGIKAYAATGIGDETILMHRMLMETPETLYVDHVNGITLDNRRCNLRNCTNSQNQANTSARKGAFKGVHFVPRFKKWRAAIRHNYKMQNIGLFENEVDAARAYDARAVELFGEFAKLNLPK